MLIFFRKIRMKKEFSSQHRQTLLFLSLIHFAIATNNEKTLFMSLKYNLWGSLTVRVCTPCSDSVLRWLFLSGSKGRNRCFNGLMGHVDLKTLQIALSLVKTGKCPHYNHWQKSWKEEIGVYYFLKWHIPNPLPTLQTTLDACFRNFPLVSALCRVQVGKLQSVFQ